MAETNNSDDVVALACDLINIPSISGDERAIGEFLQRWLIARGWQVTMQRVPPQADGAVQQDRFNVYATRSGTTSPKVLFNSHMDVVPPFFPAQLEDTMLRGRGACDAKGLVAAQMIAAQRLVDEGLGNDVGLLFVVSEETTHIGMIQANELHLTPKHLVVGEPTKLKMMKRQKGVLKVRLTSHGVAAHSGYPQLGKSAIDPLINVLHDLLHEAWPESASLGKTTMNIGTMSGGQAMNALAEQASAMLVFRLITSPDDVLERVREIVAHRVELEVYARNPPVELAVVESFETDVAAFNTDIAYLRLGTGKAYLYGAGSISEAHTPHESIELADLQRLVEDYTRIGKHLLALEE